LHRPLRCKRRRCRCPRLQSLLRLPQARPAMPQRAVIRQQQRPPRCQDHRSDRPRARLRAAPVHPIAVSPGPIRMRPARQTSPRRGSHRLRRHSQRGWRLSKSFLRTSHFADGCRYRGSGRTLSPWQEQWQEQWRQQRQAQCRQQWPPLVRSRCRASDLEALRRIPARSSTYPWAAGMNLRTLTSAAHCNTAPLSMRAGS
jgi:hypothetical protein